MSRAGCLTLALDRETPVQSPLDRRCPGSSKHRPAGLVDRDELRMLFSEGERQNWCK